MDGACDEQRLLAARWEALHAATLVPIRALASSEPPANLAAAAAARLPDGVLDSATLTAALLRRQGQQQQLLPAEDLDRQLDELEEIIEEMHALARKYQAAAAAIAPEAAAERGEGGHLPSPCDVASAIVAPLRAYEAELELKRYVVDALRSPVAPPPVQIQSLLIAWESQPMLQPLDGVLQGLKGFTRQHGGAPLLSMNG